MAPYQGSVNVVFTFTANLWEVTKQELFSCWSREQGASQRRRDVCLRAHSQVSRQAESGPRRWDSTTSSGPFSVKRRRTEWGSGWPAQARRVLPPLSFWLTHSRPQPRRSSCCKPVLSLHQAPVLGCEPGPAEPGLAENTVLTQASPGRGREQGQRTSSSGPSVPVLATAEPSLEVGELDRGAQFAPSAGFTSARDLSTFTPREWGAVCVNA